MPTINQVLRDFIGQALSEDEFNLLCDDHYQEVKLSFSDNYPYIRKISILVSFCDRHGKIDDLKTHLSELNAAKFEEFREQLEQAEKHGFSPLRSDQSSSLNQQFESLMQMGSQPATAIKTEPSNQDHPLARDKTEIRRWFNSLPPDDQIFVVTAALFTGLERQDFMDVYHEALKARGLNKAKAVQSRA